MKIAEILEDQIIHVKRGRTNQMGFEPAWNSYFDMYLHSKFFDPPLLRLEDCAFHLFLRKNINDRNPQWKMPGMRQMKRRFSVSQDKIEAIMQRLEDAHLLTKVSGLHKGADRANIPNHYVLSDPIPTLNEFLVVATAGAFGRDINPEWAVDLEDDTLYRSSVQGIPMTDTAPIPLAGTDQQTLTTNQTEGDDKDEKIWRGVLQSLKESTPTATFHSFLYDMRLVSFEDGDVILGTTRAWARQWVELQMRNKLRKAFEVELRVNGDERTVNSLRVEIVAE